MKLDNKYKIGYTAVLVVLVGYFAYTLYVGKLFYELNTSSQWDSANGHNGVRSNRFYHK
jgi:hypothetical protein